MKNKLELVRPENIWMIKTHTHTLIIPYKMVIAFGLQAENARIIAKGKKREHWKCYALPTCPN
jgi:hypothetical protein